jgi:hypothetical protein
MRGRLIYSDIVHRSTVIIVPRYEVTCCPIMIVSEPEPENYRSTAVAANIHLQMRSSEAQNTVAVAIPTVCS